VTAASASTHTTKQVVAEVCIPSPGQDYIAPTYGQVVDVEGWTETIPGSWWNWSPNNSQGPQDYTPDFPDDERGTWQGPHDEGGPDQTEEGTYNVSRGESGNSSWFHRGAPQIIVHETTYKEVMTDPGQEYIAPVVCEDDDPTPPVKVWVCKYVGTPGVDETLKNGNDGLIEVSANTLTDQEVTVGASFPDAQGRSLVVQIGGERPDISVCPVPEVPEVNYCNPAERPDGMSIAQWLREGQFNGADCFTVTPNLQCGSFDATVDGPFAGYTWRYLEGAGMAPDLSTGMALPATFGEDYSGGSVQITVWLEGPEKDYLVGTGLPNYWDGNGRTVTIDTDCAPPEPVAVSMNLTYMTACAPDATNTWRIRNSSDIPVPYTLEYYGEGVVASGIAPVGDSFVNLPRETATAILKWGGGDTGIVAGSKTKASGVDDFCPIEITGVSVTAAEVPLCGPNNDPLNIPEVENVTFEDTGWIDNERTITAVPDEGYIIDGQSEWTFYDEATPCPVTTVAPTAAAVCLPNNDTVTIPVVEGVIYTDGGWVGGERTITAAAAEGYALTEGSVTSWTFTDVPVAGCPDEPPVFSYTPTGELAYTGASTGTNGLTALAIFLMASGTALVGLRVRAQK
jgi:hypothetical protein